MSKVQVIKPNEILAEDARQNFADHVQSIAFNLTLSRRMVGYLQLIRDQQILFGDGFANGAEGNQRYEKVRQVVANRPGIHGNSFNLHKALQSRGLCYRPIEIDVGRDTQEFWAKEKLNLPVYKLTHAGELVCELLVEAGLMAARIPEKKKRKQK